MVGWKTDHEIYEAAMSLENTFIWLLDDDLPASGYPTDQIQGIRRDTEIFLSLDPQKLVDEYERVYKAALSVGDNYEPVAELRQSSRYLNAWTGDAAVEFKKQLDKMEFFCDEQQTRILRGLLGVAATHALAVEGRASFHALLKAADAAGCYAKEKQRKDDRKLEVALLFDLAGGILQRDPKSLLGSVAVTAVEMGKDIADRVIEGNDADQVMNNYRREADLLCQSFGNGLDRITKDLSGQLNDAAKPSDMYKPLPSICDVDSPDFRYENFRDTVHDPGPIGPQVEQERMKNRKARSTGDSTTATRARYEIHTSRWRPTDCQLPGQHGDGLGRRLRVHPAERAGTLDNLNRDQLEPTAAEQPPPGDPRLGRGRLSRQTLRLVHR